MRHFHGMFRHGHIFIPCKDQGRRVYRADGCIGDIGKMQHPLNALIEHDMQRIRIRVDGEEGLFVCIRHMTEVRVMEAFPEGGGYTFPFIHGRGDDQLAHQRGMTQYDLEGRSTAVAEAEDIGLIDVQLL